MSASLRLVIGNKNYSSWSLRPWLLLKHFDISFEEIRLDLSSPSFHQQVAPFSPTHKVPVLLSQDGAIWDSLAICEWVSETLLGGGGWPADIRLRALGRCVSAEMHSGFFEIRQQLPLNCRVSMTMSERSGQLQNEMARIEAIWTQCLRQSGGPWLLGEFSIADCMFAPVALRFKTYGINLDRQAKQYQSLILSHPAIQDWLADAYQEVEVIAAVDQVCFQD
jgi:glutathione S-transferase